MTAPLNSTHSHPRARALADVIAGHIREGCHVLGATAKARLPYRTHMDWMRAHPPEGSDLAYYQAIVLEALEEQRQASLKEGERVVKEASNAKANAAFNVWQKGHDSRFRRFDTHDEAPSKVELTGAEGGPLAVQNATREDALAALKAEAAKDPVLAAALKALAGGE